MTKLSIIIASVFSLIVVTGCGYFAAYAIARGATCRVNINGKYAKTSCRLINGIYFEKLNIIKNDSTGIPIEYFATERFVLYNPGSEGGQKYWADKIYFTKSNGHYLWRTDTVNISYKRIGKDRQMVWVDTSKNIGGMVGFFLSNNKTFDICPVKFSKNSWYYVDIFDQRVSSIYLYVDSKMNFTIHKFDSGVSPI